MARVNLDKVGTWAGTICAVHCVLTGLALGLLSVAGLGFVATPSAEAAFIGITVLVGIAALIHGHSKHHSMIPAVLFVIGLGLIASSHFFGHNHEHAGHVHHEPNPLGTFLSVGGGGMIVLFHVVNQRMQHRCGGKHCRHDH